MELRAQPSTGVSLVYPALNFHPKTSGSKIITAERWKGEEDGGRMVEEKGEEKWEGKSRGWIEGTVTTERDKMSDMVSSE
jgi:hypothetical protein